LQNVMTATAAGQSDIAYAVIEDAEHKIVVHTDKARVGQTLDASQAANDKAGKDVVTREVAGPGGAPLLEAIAPIFVGDDRWGAVHYGISLAEIQQLTAESKRQAQEVGRNAVIYGVAVAAGFLVIALIVAMLSAKRVVRP